VVGAVPTIVVFQAGKVVQELVGLAPKARLAAMLESVLQSDAPALDASVG
jgi:thioredoxin-like negative regulator of GroEL